MEYIAKGLVVVKAKWLVLILAFLLLFCGCMDVESYLQPPRPEGQQQAVHTALTQALSRGEAGDTYTLKYATVNTTISPAHSNMYTFETGGAYFVELNKTGERVSSPFAFVDALEIVREELYDDDESC